MPAKNNPAGRRAFLQAAVGSIMGLPLSASAEPVPQSTRLGLVVYVLGSAPGCKRTSPIRRSSWKNAVASAPAGCNSPWASGMKRTWLSFVRRPRNTICTSRLLLICQGIAPAWNSWENASSPPGPPVRNSPAWCCSPAGATSPSPPRRPLPGPHGRLYSRSSSPSPSLHAITFGWPSRTTRTSV